MNIYPAVLMFLIFMATVSLSPIASAGFLDVYNKANQAISTVENAKYNAERAGRIIPKSKKAPAQPAEQVSAPESNGTLTPKARTAIEKAKRAWVAAFKAQDWEALVDQYAEDAVILPPDDNIQSGREAIRAYYADDADTSNEVFETSDISGDENIAYVQGAFSFKLTLKDQPTVAVSGKYIEIWQKQEDGAWLITHDIWNANPTAAN